LSDNKLYLLPAGHCLIDRSALDTRRQPGELTRLPIWCYLIETPDGPILVDTGMPALCIADSNGLFKGTEADGRIVPQMAEDDLVTRILARIGYSAQDLLGIVSTHWHFDHAGGNQLFPDTEIIVQQAEYEAALRQDGYFDFCKDPGLNYRFVNGDTEIAPGVMALATPGHTPGHQSVLIRTKASGSVLLTIDAAYCRANFEEDVPFAVHDAAAARESVARLTGLAKDENAKVFFGHDEEQAAIWKPHPFVY